MYYIYGLLFVFAWTLFFALFLRRWKRVNRLLSAGNICYNELSGARAYCMGWDCVKSEKQSSVIINIKKSFVFSSSNSNIRLYSEFFAGNADDERKFLTEYGLGPDEDVRDFLLRKNELFVKVSYLRVPFANDVQMSFEQQIRFYGKSSLEACMQFFSKAMAELHKVQSSALGRTRSGMTASGALAVTVCLICTTFAAPLAYLTALAVWEFIHMDTNTKVSSTVIVDTPQGKAAVTRWVDLNDPQTVFVDADDASGFFIESCQLQDEPVSMGGGLAQVNLRCEGVKDIAATLALSLNLHKDSYAYVRYCKPRYRFFYYSSLVISKEDALAYVATGRFKFRPAGYAHTGVR